MNLSTGIFLSLLFLFFTSCNQRYNDCQKELGEIIDCRLEKKINRDSFCYDDPRVQEIINQMACNKLITIEEAIQIALINNPQIRSVFQEIGIAQADLLEAGLLSNPLFDGYIRYPHQQGLSLNTQFSVVMNFIDLFLIPLRIKVAKLELEKTKVRVANEILDIAFEVKKTFYELQAEEEKKSLLHCLFKIALIEHEIVSKQLQVGNIYFIDQEIAFLEQFEMQVEIEKVNTQIIALREKLNRLMGFCEDRGWYVDHLEEACMLEIPRECLESIGYCQRLDLEEARWRVYNTSKKIGLNAGWTVIDGKIGVSTEKDLEGNRATGPTFSGEIPLFNYGQGVRAKLFAEFLQAQDRLEEMEIRVLSEIREAYLQVSVYSEILKRYTCQILPIQNNILESTESLYNVMGKGIFDLLKRKKTQLRSYLDFRMTLKDYWIAYVQLEKALGGNLFPLSGEGYQTLRRE